MRSVPASPLVAVAQLAARRQRRRSVPLEQLAFELGPERPRWSLSRLVLKSPHRQRIIERLEFVRRFFPELEGVTVRVGLAQKRGVLGWGSLDPDQPGIWVRPRRLESFTVAHEFTHLLQARNLVPRGERSCDLFALARSPLLVDHAPSYLRLPMRLRRTSRVEPADAQALCELARHSIARRASGDRRYLSHFEREAERLLSAPPPLSMRL
jgi:hypothetical protein